MLLSRWKIVLFVMAALIVVVTLVYTSLVVSRLANEERKKVELWAAAVKANETVGDSIQNASNAAELSLRITQSNQYIPYILTDDVGNIQDAGNFGSTLDSNKIYIQNQLAKLKKENIRPIVIRSEHSTQYVYFKRSRLLSMLALFPALQFLLIGAFVLVGYIVVSSARKAEQNQVWVGLAKETAHQLGTPLTSILAWIEHLRMNLETQPTPDDSANLDILQELRNDVYRLEIIADRFSKIGAVPQLNIENIYTVVQHSFDYMKLRAPRRVQFAYPHPYEQEPLLAEINVHLFNWVLENILKNSLDAMEGQGNITAEIFTDNTYTYIDIHDTGKGIPPGKLNTIFKPGYTTKQRGWGLGLSLARRIIENYHFGKIFVKQSTPEQGTTMRIQLPKATPPHPIPPLPND